MRWPLDRWIGDGGVAGAVGARSAERGADDAGGMLIGCCTGCIAERGVLTAISGFVGGRTGT
jgi:hypothetical protein